MRSDQQQAINRLAGTSATAFLCAVLCVYPLYIDKFSNLGVTKFTGCFTLFLLFRSGWWPVRPLGPVRPARATPTPDEM